MIQVVAEHLEGDRLAGLYRIGVDEVSYRKGPRFLTVVADHDRDGAVVWAREGHDAATLEAFYDELGKARCAQLQAVSMNLGDAYRHATNSKAAGARQCVDPFHVVKLANQAIDTARRWAWNQTRAQSRIEPPRRRGRPRHDAPPRPLHAAARDERCGGLP